MSSQLEKWDSGGILLTYWCNAACADCYENSSPRKKRVMPLEDAKEYLKELNEIRPSNIPINEFIENLKYTESSHLSSGPIAKWIKRIVFEN